MNGAPILLILAGAAIRVADLVRNCRPLRAKKGGEIAKVSPRDAEFTQPFSSFSLSQLFAKHIKLSEHSDQLRKSGVNIAVGTPDRVGKLLADGKDDNTKEGKILIELFIRSSSNERADTCHTGPLTQRCEAAQYP